MVFGGGLLICLKVFFPGEWAMAAIIGWSGAGLLGLTSWWTTKKAMSGDNNTFFKYAMGGMTVRFFIYGIFAGVVVGFKLLHASGFVGGLLAGLIAFIGLEVVVVYYSACLRSGSQPAEGVANRG